MKRLVGLIVAAAILTSAQTQSPGDVGTRFVQTGNDLRLDFEAEVPEEFLILVWRVNNTDVLVTYTETRQTIAPKYRNRIEFTDKKYSVILKNLQEADSGDYTAGLKTLQGEDKQLAQYKVEVQDPVSPVELTVDSDVSNESCNITVSCRTTKSPLHVINGNFMCFNQTCVQRGGEGPKVTTSGSSLVVSLVVGKIICNHSNNVNWTKDVKTIEGVCSRDPVALPFSPNIAAVAVPAFFGCLAAVLLVVALIVIFRRKTRNSNSENIENTIYATPEVRATVQPPDQNEDEMNTTYSKVGLGEHRGIKPATVQPPDVLPESCYATVQKPK